jgi:predicted homoserine dehydrogenase-like protein
VHDVFDLFDFDKYGTTGVVDYILGAQPGGGVFVVGHCDNPIQQDYLNYYKLNPAEKMGQPPYYLFYRPYHLCHLETPWAIGSAVLKQQPILTPAYGRMNDVYAYAKQDLKPGDVVEHGIGGDLFYGLIEQSAPAEDRGQVPIAILEEEGGQKAVVIRAIPKDAPLTADAVDVPDTFLYEQFRKQLELTTEVESLV